MDKRNKVIPESLQLNTYALTELISKLLLTDIETGIHCAKSKMSNSIDQHRKRNTLF